MNIFGVLIFSLALLYDIVAGKSDRRIVAMGDLHGDLANSVEIMKFAKIINEDHRWIGEDTIFVQTVIYLSYQ